MFFAGELHERDALPAQPGEGIKPPCKGLMKGLKMQTGEGCRILDPTTSSPSVAKMVKELVATAGKASCKHAGCVVLTCLRLWSNLSASGQCVVKAWLRRASSVPAACLQVADIKAFVCFHVVSSHPSGGHDTGAEDFQLTTSGLVPRDKPSRPLRFHLRSPDP